MKKIIKYSLCLFVSMFVGLIMYSNVEAIGCGGETTACLVCDYNVDLGDNSTNIIQFKVVDKGNGNAEIVETKNPENFILDYTSTNLVGSTFIPMSKNKFYCPALYYKLVVDSKPAKPGEVAKVTYKISVGANNSIGKNLKLNSKDGNSIELSNVTQKTKVCSFNATIKDANGTKEENKNLSFNIVDGKLPSKDASGTYNLTFKNNITADSFGSGSSCDYNGEQLYILCQSGNTSSTAVNYTSECTISTEKIIFSEKGEIDNPENIGVDKDKNNNNNKNKTPNNNSNGCEALEPLLGDIQFAWDLIKIAAPILVIVFGSLDYGQAVISGDDNALKKATDKFRKRLMFAVLLFFIPFLIDLLFSISGLDNKVSDIVCGIK